MSEPRRLLDDDGTPFERSLLSALRDERPSPELERLMRQGIAAVGVSTASKVALAGWLKVAAASVVAAGVGAGISVWQHQHVPLPAPAVAPLQPRAPAAAVVPPKPEEAPAAAPAEKTPETPAAQPARARPAASGSGDLREEIRLLDQARAGVRAGTFEQALKLLERYDRRFPRGQFRQEAQVLRVEALERSGKKSAALELGRKFVAEHPESPHVERVESVTGSQR